MALTLRVTSFQSQALGALATKTFGSQGGTIGRRNDNDWVLPDPERIVSGQHARIIFRNGVFAIADMSVNGTFVNGSPQPVGDGVEQPLQDGDRLQIGEYELVVSLDATDHRVMTSPTGFDMSPAGGFAPDRSRPAHTGPTGSRAPVHVTSPSGSLGGTFGGQDIGQPSAVDPLDLFGDNSRPQAQPRPSAHADHSSSLEDFYQPPAVASPRPGGAGAASGIPDDWDMTGFSAKGADSAPPLRVAAQPPLPPRPGETLSSAPVAGDVASAMVAVLQAAGLDAATARAAAASPELIGVLGALLGITIKGMFEVLKARSEVKSQFRVPVTMMRSLENNPLKFSATPVQALQTLLAQQNQAYMGPVEAFTEGFQDIKAHQMAMMAGMRAAFDSVIERFDPAELQERFQKRLKSGSLISIPGKGRYWEMYRDLYEELTQDADLNFQRLFGEEFARAYEEQMNRLTKVRK